MPGSGRPARPSFLSCCVLFSALLSMLGTSQAVAPGEVLWLANFKLQLPIQSNGGQLVVKQPALRTYVNPTYWFAKSSMGTDVVVVTVKAGGATSTNSHYPRTELSEVVYTGSGGEQAAAWSIAGSQVHTLTFRGATLKLTPVRPITVIAQVKGKTTTPLQIRVRGSNSGPYVQMAAFNGKVYTLDDNYVLGKEYTIRIAAGRNKIQVYYQDMSKPRVTLSNTAETRVTNAQFKVGNYLQSSTDNGEKADATAVVWIYPNLQITVT